MFRRLKKGNLLAATYLLVVFAVSIPLIKDLAIHHGNGIAFLAAMILTTPLSWLFFWIIDQVAPVNAFYVTGWSYLLAMAVLAACALLNATVINFLGNRLLRRSSDS